MATFFVHVKYYPKYPILSEWIESQPRRFVSLAAARKHADCEMEKPVKIGRKIVEVIQQKRRIEGHVRGNAVRLRLERDAAGEIVRVALV